MRRGGQIMLNMEICPCGECKISKWCIIEQVKFQDHDQRNPINWCGVLERYLRGHNIENNGARQEQALQ